MRKRRTIAATTCVVVLLGVVAGVSIARTADEDAVPDQTSASTTVGAAPTARRAADLDSARQASEAFLDAYVDPDGRVVRRDQDDDTVSEGQAYGMMIAVAIGDRERFDLIWDWTQANIQRSDKLLSFQWADGKIVDPLPATDADLDAGRALLIAAQRWNAPTYRAQALEIGESILLRETIDVGPRKVLVAGPWARKSPAVVNPSYFSPRAYDAYFAATGDRRWQQLQATSLEAIDGLTQNAPSLPPDWARVHGTEIVPSYQPGDPSKGVRYAYEAARVLPRYAEMCGVQGEDPDAAAPAVGRRIVARAWPFMQAQGADGPTADYRADGRRIGGNRNALATVAAASAADAAGAFDERDRLLVRAQQVQDQSLNGLNYYGAAWVALGRIMLTTDLLGTCDSTGAIG